ncbi:hypothetical protein [Hoyosella altamirensis]|uniref:TobH protein n=1 Tax=Hoyosella altamirensis TaxID=616997 RepID=A0A839RHT8_9ACTN|nr:hypothetical protein [Hoyosella altamirensis]MBB3035631.1 hypothetical protein [Hoyosella altamirensis]
MDTLLPGVGLDDADGLLAADREGLLRSAALSGAQVRAAAVAAEEGALAALSTSRPRSLVLVARRGSALSAVETVSAAFARQFAVPVVAADHAPSWVGPLDVVILAGDDAGDPVLVESVDRAVRHGCEVVVVAPEGGPLQAAGSGRAITLPPRVVVPDPFAMAGYIAAIATVLAALEGSLHDGVQIDLMACADALDHEALLNHPQRETYENPAKSLVEKVTNHRVVIAADSAASRAIASHASQIFVRIGGQLAPDADLADVLSGLPVLASVSVPPGFDPIFHDPQLDGPPPVAPLRVLLLATNRGRAEAERRSALLRGNAVLVVPEHAADGKLPGVELQHGLPREGSRSSGAEEQSDRGKMKELCELMVLASRLEMAAVYVQMVGSH